MQDKELYTKILGVMPPWVVQEVRLELKQRSVAVVVEYDHSIPVACPVCQGQATVHDHQTRKWRHFDTMQLKTIIECAIPRARCEEHGMKQLPVAWAESNARFTALFEALVIGWLSEASISGVSELLRLSWDEVAGIHRSGEILNQFDDARQRPRMRFVAMCGGTSQKFSPPAPGLLQTWLSPSPEAPITFRVSWFCHARHRSLTLWRLTRKMCATFAFRSPCSKDSTAFRRLLRSFSSVCFPSP